MRIVIIKHSSQYSTCGHVHIDTYIVNNALYSTVKMNAT